MKNLFIFSFVAVIVCLVPLTVSAGQDGVCIEGDCINGIGTLEWSDNDGTYVGEFKNGKEHGHGTYTMPNGYRFEGEFKKGKREGYGEGVYKDGRVMKGYWENDGYAGEQKND